MSVCEEGSSRALLFSPVDEGRYTTTGCWDDGRKKEEEKGGPPFRAPRRGREMERRRRRRRILVPQEVSNGLKKRERWADETCTYVTG